MSTSLSLVQQGDDTGLEARSAGIRKGNFTSQKLRQTPSNFGDFNAAIFVSTGKSNTKPASILSLQTEQEVTNLIQAGDSLVRENNINILAFPAIRPPSEGLLPLPLSEGLYGVIEHEFKLPDNFLQILNTGMACTSQSQLGDNDSPLKSFVIQSNATSVRSFSIALIHDTKRCSTNAIVFGLVEKEILEVVNHLQATIIPLHWARLPLVVLEALNNGWTDYVKYYHNEIYQVEALTRMRRFETHFVVDALNKGHKTPIASQHDFKEADFKVVDLTDIIRSLNSAVTELAITILHCVTTEEMLNNFERILESSTHDKHLDLPNGDDSIRIKILYLKSWSAGLKARCTYLTKRAEAQVQTVYSMIAQRDNAVNQEISKESRKIAQLSRDDNTAMRRLAEDSKKVALATARDSAAMRVIAGVTVFFLPATFVATFFSTTFFDFKPAQQGDLVSKWIWLYWVVTAGLTVIIHATWWITSRRKEKTVESEVALFDK